MRFVSDGQTHLMESNMDYFANLAIMRKRKKRKKMRKMRRKKRKKKRKKRKRRRKKT